MLFSYIFGQVLGHASAFHVLFIYFLNRVAEFHFEVTIPRDYLVGFRQFWQILEKSLIFSEHLQIGRALWLLFLALFEEVLYFFQFLQRGWLQGLLIRLYLRFDAFLILLDFIELLIQQLGILFVSLLMRLQFYDLSIFMHTFFNFFRCFFTPYPLKQKEANLS